METALNISQKNNFYQDNSNFTGLLVNNDWVLVNEIKKNKTIYNFHTDNVLTISKNDSVSEAKWHYVNPDYIRITSDNEINVIKISFRDDDVLTLDIDRRSNELAVFVNQNKSDIPLNSREDITTFLHNKYINKAKDIIYNHQYYYIEQSIEYGPFTAKQLIDKAKDQSISSQCFVRETQDDDYSKRLRIIDLIEAI